MKTEHAQISKRIGTVGFFTLLSRLLGLIRDSVMAWAFGATMVADAFYVAFRIPNMLRRLVAEGSLTVAFVPIYTEYLKDSRAKAKEAASVVFTYLSIFLTLLVLVGIFFAPQIVKLIAYGFTNSPEKFDLTVYLTRLMFPYIFLISLVALAMGMLNSLKHFAAPAASPILLNLGIIAGAVILWRIFTLPATGLAIGVLIGGILQLALQIPPLIKEGMIPRLNFNFHHPALKGLLLLMGPSAFGAAVYQLNVLVVTFFASMLPDGSVSYLWYADRISEFSLGIYSIAVATVTLPALSTHAADKDVQSFKDTMNYGLKLAFLIDIPSAVGLYILALPVVSMLFERGRFDHATSIATAGALALFAIKIPFVSGIRNLVPGFFAQKDMKTPVVVSVIAVAVNAISAYLLMQRYKHIGLAAALVISSAVQFFILLYLFRKKVGTFGGVNLLKSVSRTIIASAVMGGVILTAKHFINPFLAGPLYQKVGAIGLLMAIGIGVFLFVIKIISKDEYAALIGVFKMKRTKTSINPSAAETL